MVLATLWTTRRDTQKLETCSAQPWTTMKLQTPAKQLRDPNSNRTTSLAQALHWLGDEELHLLFAVGIGTWKEQTNARWREE